jgi:hypothetical protein
MVEVKDVLIRSVISQLLVGHPFVLLTEVGDDVLMKVVPSQRNHQRHFVLNMVVEDYVMWKIVINVQEGEQVTYLTHLTHSLTHSLTHLFTYK